MHFHEIYTISSQNLLGKGDHGTELILIYLFILHKAYFALSILLISYILGIWDL